MDSTVNRDALPELHMDASAWATRDDVYESFFKAVGAPPWYGKNFNALNDSIVTGDINAIEVPYRLVIENLSEARREAREMAANFIAFIDELEHRGCPVSVRVVEKHRTPAAEAARQIRALAARLKPCP